MTKIKKKIRELVRLEKKVAEDIRLTKKYLSLELAHIENKSMWLLQNTYFFHDTGKTDAPDT